MSELLILLSVHFVADFVLQSDWMAQGKSRAWLPLLAHTGLYAACFAWLGLPFVLVTFATHTATDYVTSRLTSRLWFFQREGGIWTQAPNTLPLHHRTLVNPWTPIEGSRRHWFFVAIGLDQLIHAWTLALTYRWLIGG